MLHLLGIHLLYINSSREQLRGTLQAAEPTCGLYFLSTISRRQGVRLQTTEALAWLLLHQTQYQWSPHCLQSLPVLLELEKACQHSDAFPLPTQNMESASRRGETGWGRVINNTDMHMAMFEEQMILANQHN